jgi:hypothetical protein
MERLMNRAGRVVLVSMSLAALSGCAKEPRPQPLSRVLLTPAPRSDKTVTIDPLSAADQPGALVPARREALKPLTETAPQEVSSTAIENVNVPGAAPQEIAATMPASTQPATTNVSASSGQYLTLGGVVMEVNGTPIYANQVLRIIEPNLALRAKELPEQQFRLLAERHINDVLKGLQDLQLGYAAAERNLDQKDKDLADGLTMQWRQRQITAAGGSEEVARRNAAARGEDFDELVQQQYRNWMRRIYYDKRVTPRIQPTAADIRAYYDQNYQREFSTPESARFRLIKIDPAKSGGDREAARKRIEELRNRIAKAGESFDALARSANDDTRMRASGGDVGVIQRGAFAIEPVEKAVWETPIGEVTPVVETPNAFYIALVEEKTPGTVQPFDDEEVQKRIHDILTSRDFNRMVEQIHQNLRNNAAVRSDSEMRAIPLEMVMQNYAKWRGDAK